MEVTPGGLSGDHGCRHGLRGDRGGRVPRGQRQRRRRSRYQPGEDRAVERGPVTGHGVRPRRADRPERRPWPASRDRRPPALLPQQRGHDHLRRHPERAARGRPADGPGPGDRSAWRRACQGRLLAPGDAHLDRPAGDHRGPGDPAARAAIREAVRHGLRRRLRTGVPARGVRDRRLSSAREDRDRCQRPAGAGVRRGHRRRRWSS
jgi:hypothetical protein